MPCLTTSDTLCLRKPISQSFLESFEYFQNIRQRQLEEERQLKLQQLSEARERKKREAEEYELRLIQLAESDSFFQSKACHLNPSLLSLIFIKQTKITRIIEFSYISF